MVRREPLCVASRSKSGLMFGIAWKFLWLPQLLRDLWILRLSWSRACWQLSLRIGRSLSRQIKSDFIPIHSENQTKTNRMNWIDLREFFCSPLAPPAISIQVSRAMCEAVRANWTFRLHFCSELKWSAGTFALRNFFFLMHFEKSCKKPLLAAIPILTARWLECSWHSCLHDVSIDQRTSNGPTECRQYFQCARHHVVSSLIQFIIYFQFKTFVGIEKKNTKRLKNGKAIIWPKIDDKIFNRSVSQSTMWRISLAFLEHLLLCRTSVYLHSRKQNLQDADRATSTTHTHVFTGNAHTSYDLWIIFSRFFFHSQRSTLLDNCTMCRRRPCQPSRRHWVRDGFPIVHVSARIQIEG